MMTNFIGAMLKMSHNSTPPFKKGGEMNIATIIVLLVIAIPPLILFVLDNQTWKEAIKDE